ncbi:MAG TPA: glycosyltransferase family 2 protein [Gemmatimonadaceae bacterium]
MTATAVPSLTATADPPPSVSVIVPCRNEAAFVGMCLESIAANDFPRDQLEVLVVDGMSDDGTRDTVARYAARDPRIRLLENPRRITPTALNIGLAAARGEIIMRMDAHNAYPPHYISTLVTWLVRSGADNVGGAWITRPANGTRRARAIAAALAHPFGVGNAHFRLGVREPRWVDTVPFGCYRREVFTRIGPFDEELVRNQDDELNLRLIRHGGRILLVPAVSSTYHARESLAKLWRTYYQYGYFKPLVVRKVRGVLTVRQLIPALFVLSVVASVVLALWVPAMALLLAVIVGAYVLVDLACAASIAAREGLGVGLAACAVFPVLHLSYGAGFLRGTFDFLVRRRRRAHDAATVPITR